MIPPDPLLGALGQLSKDLTRDLSRSAIERLVHKDASSDVEQAIDSRLADVIAGADPTALATQIDAVTKILGYRRRMNAKRAVEVAMGLVAALPEADRHSPDVDWFARWYEAVETVSDDTIREMWARAYATQARTDTRALSLRALDTLRLMDRPSVYAFRRMSQACEMLGGLFASDHGVLNAVLAPDERDALLDLQLIHIEETVSRHLVVSETWRMTFKLPDDRSFGDPFKVYRLSARGRELIPTFPPDLDVDYDSPAAIDLDAPHLGLRYASLVARGFAGMPLKVTLTPLRPAARGRRQAQDAPAFTWEDARAGWVPNPSATRDVPPDEMAILTRGWIGSPHFDG